MTNSTPSAITGAFIFIGRITTTTKKPKTVAIHAPREMHSKSPTPKIPPTMKRLELR